MHELVPKDQLGAFFGRRFSLATATGVVVSLSAGLFLDHVAERLFANDLYGYSVVFSISVVFGLIGVIFVSRIPEQRYQVSHTSVFQEIRRPFRDPNFRNLIHFLASWNIAIYLATPFFSVYMLKRLEMNLTWVLALIVIGRLVNIVFLRLWGSFSDKISHKSVLAVSAPLCLLCILGWTFTTMPEKHFLTFPLLIVLHVLMGVAMAGITLSIGNIGLKLAPSGEGTGYLATTNFVSALAAGLAPVFSGRLVDFFIDRRLAWTIDYSGPAGVSTIELINFQQWDFLFFFSFAIGLYAVHRLSMVTEPGEVGEKVVVVELFSALGRELRDFSTVATIRNVVNLIPLKQDRPDDEEPL
jgi:MFS family permease